MSFAHFCFQHVHPVCVCIPCVCIYSVLCSYASLNHFHVCTVCPFVQIAVCCVFVLVCLCVQYVSVPALSGRHGFTVKCSYVPTVRADNFCVGGWISRVLKGRGVACMVPAGFFCQTKSDFPLCRGQTTPQLQEKKLFTWQGALSLSPCKMETVVEYLSAAEIHNTLRNETDIFS